MLQRIEQKYTFYSYLDFRRKKNL